MGNITYKCPTCGGDMGFDAQSQNWKCLYCDDIFTLEELNAKGRNTVDEQKIEKHTELSEDEKAAAVSTDGTVGKDLVQYTCSHCGAEIVTDRATSASICAFCGNPIIMSEQVVGDFAPQYVIPFKIDKSSVMESFRKFSKKPLTPKDFDPDRIVEKMQGIYIPFWLYSGTLDARICCDAEIKRVRRTSDYIYTDHLHYNVVRAGSLSFEKVPADASSKTDDAAMDSIEPYDFADIKPFNIGYLAGYLAERYDQDMLACRSRAEERIINTGKDELLKTCSYDSISVNDYQHNIEFSEAEYALMPTWLLYTKYKDKDYLFAMNGQTGKFIGNPPIDHAKLALYSGIPALLILLLFLLF